LSDDFEQVLRALRDQKFKVLDDGFIRVVDCMGSDASVVQAARVSYGEGTKKVQEDRGLIRYLMRHHHTTPFEMCEIKLHVRVPMDCWRQWIRHRTASVNEYSTRYSLAVDAAYTTQPDSWRLQTTENNQGSSGTIDSATGARLTEREGEIHAACREIYNERINAGIAREQARKDLPLSTYTEAYWKIDLHNLLHFLELRMDSHAQYEIRQYANTIGNEIVSKLFPLTWESFLEYRLNSLTLSASEVSFLGLIFTSQPDDVIALMQEKGWLKKQDESYRLSREAAEFADKLRNMGISPPWEKMRSSN
jgi:thymidylate synthase (FAD)